MCAGWRRLLPPYAAAHGFEFQADILSGLHGAANRLAYEWRNFDTALLDV
jgi:hypothetical protein